jgi:hypothetical protein
MALYKLVNHVDEFFSWCWRIFRLHGIFSKRKKTWTCFCRKYSNARAHEKAYLSTEEIDSISYTFLQLFQRKCQNHQCQGLLLSRPHALGLNYRPQFITDLKGWRDHEVLNWMALDVRKTNKRRIERHMDVRRVSVPTFVALFVTYIEFMHRWFIPNAHFDKSTSRLRLIVQILVIEPSVQTSVSNMCFMIVDFLLCLT